MKILLSSESAVVGEMLRQALEAAGHQVVVEVDSAALATGARDAGALLVEPARARQTIALVRDRGFAGRALLLADLPPEQQPQALKESGADAILAVEPMEEVARRFAVAVGGRRRVLVVDDSEIAAQMIASELQKGGFEVVIATEVEAATSLILKRTTRPDLILLDIHMPKVNGAQFCRFIKKNDRFRAIKVFFCSADSKESVARYAQECGADGFVLKGELLGNWIAQNT